MASPGEHAEALGPGAWTLDTGHFPQPVTPFVAELFPPAAAGGFRAATARYGLLMDTIEWAFPGGWAYLGPRPVEGVATAATREHWQAILAASPGLRARLARSAAVFSERSWRAELDHWERTTKPRLLERQRELQALAPDRLARPELLEHLTGCRANMREAVYEHHRLNVAPAIPAGDFLARAGAASGHAPAELVQLIRGGGAAPISAQLAARDPELVSCWSAGGGSDVCEPTLGELGELLLAAVDAACRTDERDRAVELECRIRAELAPAERIAFDESLAEARAAHRLRDERAAYCDLWACGLARRAILAAGRLLADAGTLELPEQLLGARWEEMRALLRGDGGADVAAITARAQARLAAAELQPPVMLGDPPGRPIPLDWLEPASARTERAFRTFMMALSAAAAPAGDATIAGIGASPGRYAGCARIVHEATDLVRIDPGDVLVTVTATPAIAVVANLLGAIVTDHGGLMSHAAIVARELGIPAVVGTGEATARIRDGERVHVDGDSGRVEVP